MIFRVQKYVLRPPEQKDVQRLYEYKNDPDIAALLGGFHTGLSSVDISDWMDIHRKRKDEIIWIISDPGAGDECLGHVGFYNIDFRIRSAEIAIMIGNKRVWDKGLGSAVVHFLIDWGFRELNLNRIYLSVLQNNERAIKVYHSLGFIDEGKLRQAQYKNGRYINVVLMSLLRSEYEGIK